MQRVSQFLRQNKKIVIPGAILTLVVVIALIAHGSNNNPKVAQVSEHTTNTSAAPDTDTSAIPTTPTLPAITGFGALQDDWNAYHTQDPNYAFNKVYDPTPGLGTDSSHTDKYYAVVATDGRVTNYEMRLPNGGTLGAAQKEVLQEFPTDALILWQHTKGECSQMEISSAILGNNLGDPSVAGGSQGQVFVEFQTDTPATETQWSYYDPSNVNHAVLSQASYNTASDAPGC